MEGTQVVELGNFGRGSGPDVNAAGKTDGQVVVGGPVDQVEIEVVLKGRRIKYFEGNFCDFPGFVMRNDNVVFIEASHRPRVEALGEGRSSSEINTVFIGPANQDRLGSH